MRTSETSSNQLARITRFYLSTLDDRHREIYEALIVRQYARKELPELLSLSSSTINRSIAVSVELYQSEFEEPNATPSHVRDLIAAYLCWSK